MANSTAVLTDSTTLLTDAQSSGSSWTAASTTKNLATDNVDLTGMVSTVQQGIAQAKRALQLILANTDATGPDPLHTLAANIAGTLS
jgi:hypothetical protein